MIITSSANLNPTFAHIIFKTRCMPTASCVHIWFTDFFHVCLYACLFVCLYNFLFFCTFVSKTLNAKPACMREMEAIESLY